MPRKSIAGPSQTPAETPVEISIQSARKSRPSRAAPTSSPDPIAPSPVATTAPSRKRRRKDDGDAEWNGDIKTIVEEFTPEQQLEAWQEFAAEHYEMVEQLPLELHRNFRLLRELDDGCVAQTSKLQDQIRSYIAARQELVKRCAALTGAQGDEITIQSEDVAEDVAMDVDPTEPEAIDKSGEEPAGETTVGQQTENSAMEVDGSREVVDSDEDEAIDKPEDQAVDHPMAKDMTQSTEALEVVENEPAATVASELPPIAVPREVEDEEEEEEEKLEDRDSVNEKGKEAVSETPVETTETEPLPELASVETNPDDEFIEDGQPATVDAPVLSKEAEAPPMPSLPPDMGPLVSDGEGGLVVSSSNAVIVMESGDQNGESTEDARVEGQTEVSGEGVVPSAGTGIVAAESHSGVDDQDARATETNAGVSGAVDSATTAKDLEAPATSSSAQVIPRKIPAQLLPEIGRLSREIVRNCEEKVALAYGAYNSIDRHIRALDSALSAQETSLILGLRPDTLPSAAIDQTLNLAGDTSLISNNQSGEEGGMTSGLGGTVGGNRGRKKGKKGKKVEAPVVEQEQIVALVPLLDADGEAIDPNEPTYCYCHRVSSGTMIGCDNDDCPVEWFHLPCTGLQVEPSGKWLCNLCKPKIGLGMGGAGTVQPSVIEKRAIKKKKPTKR